MDQPAATKHDAALAPDEDDGDGGAPPDGDDGTDGKTATAGDSWAATEA